jgi:Fuc2NAc and GlcNAc transferase
MRISLLIVPLATLLASWIGTGVMRRYALSHHILDVPNARSSHTAATPRGGGAAIVVTTAAALLWLTALDIVSWEECAAVVGASALVAALGFGDDHRPISALVRLVGHFGAAGWLIIWLERVPAIFHQDAAANLAWFALLYAALYVVWLVNLTNFMDGIDGLAAVEAVTVCAAASLLTFRAIPSPQWIVPAVVACAALGFLIWNWPPARIFMGDVGSGSLGMMFATMSLLAGNSDPGLYWAWVVLLGAFIVDATVTLLRRLVRGEKLHQAHRTHAYQFAAARWTHKRVTIAIGAINLLWLFPIAALAADGVLSGPAAVAIAYTPLAVAAVWLGAGSEPARNLAIS